MTAHIVTEYGEDFNVHFYYGQGVSGDNLRRPSRPSDFQLWEREAERAETYYLANSYRYTNDLTLARSLIINLRIMKGAQDEEPVTLSRRMLDQRYRRSTRTARYLTQELFDRGL